jgi:hypothetical protein
MTRRARSRRVQRGGGVEFNTSMDYIVSDSGDPNIKKQYITAINTAFNNLISLINGIQPGVLGVKVPSVKPIIDNNTIAWELYDKFHTLNDTLKNACNAKRGWITSTPADKINAARKVINQGLHEEINRIHQMAKQSTSSSQGVGLNFASIARLGM